MDYHYEALNDQSFQKLCQALIAVQHPDVQCLPVGQPDGGRDAYFSYDELDQGKFVVFQVKFSLDPKSKTERDAVAALIKTEKKKIGKLIERGLTHYFLVTNIPGTGHLDGGSIDRANRELAKAFDVPTQVWWRSDLDRRLDSASDIKWSYPEILKATDVLPVLVRAPGASEDLPSARTLKSYLAAQYETDGEVKFKQVDLKRKLTELFVDLPLGNKRTQNEQNRHRRQIHVADAIDIDSYVSQLDTYEDYEREEENPFNHSALAAAFLLQMPLWKGVSRFVVEGAPGQGKSTVTQFLCQVNRLRLLKSKHELAAVANEHKAAPVRVPFRVDLRDFAAWVSGRHPFANAGEVTVPEEGRRSLESFLVMQVEWLSGGLRITQDELLQFLARSHSAVVLDGFDEIADIETRTRIVDEICQAASRLNAHAKSMQIIVTSRPAAFANSPGFPEEGWVHLELKDLRRDNIDAYKGKWIKAQGLNKEEADLVSSTLLTKLEQPHLRDLARNPMQLAILLHLIHVQGVALPEKRTTLYEEYMKLFFNREAEKSAVVRDHRELLLSIHGVLAWVLHTQAEGGTGSGSITKVELRREVKAYLETEEHDPKLTERLFKGTVERVGALVSRVEGMFEFEVQPLREYFAARHLYKTAPYSPPGYGRKGTRPDRFEALARSFYWTNVTRFFCGFYDVGELGSLVDGITALSDDESYALINQPRRLAMMLLSDQVFSQAPRAMKRLVAVVANEPGFQRLASAVAMRHRSEMGLPANAGGDFLLEACKNKLDIEDDPSQSRVLRQVIRENSSPSELASFWTSRFKAGLTKSDPLREAMDFGVVSAFNPHQIEKLAKSNVDLRLRWLMLADHYETIAQDRQLHERAKETFFDGKLQFPLRWRRPADSVTGIEVLTQLLQPYSFAALFSETEAKMAIYVMLDGRYGPSSRALLEQVRKNDYGGVVDPLRSFALFVINLLRTDASEWKEDIVHWSELVDGGFDEVPGNYLMVRTAMIATVSNAGAARGDWDEQGFAATKGLVKRLCYARHKGSDVNWWRDRLAEVTTETASACLTVLLSWGAPDVLAPLRDAVGKAVNKLSVHEWSRLWSMASVTSWATRASRPAIPEEWFNSVGSLSPRMVLLLIGRVDNREAVRRVSLKCFVDYAGDDMRILYHALETELHGAEEVPVDWDHVRNLSRRARRIGVGGSFPISRSLLAKVPEKVAKDVLSNSPNHWDQLVAICEQAYATTVAQAAPRVLQVAEKEGWFAPSD